MCIIKVLKIWSVDNELVGESVFVQKKKVHERWKCVITILKIWTVVKKLEIISVFVETYYARNEYVLWQFWKFSKEKIH